MILLRFPCTSDTGIDILAVYLVLILMLYSRAVHGVHDKAREAAMLSPMASFTSVRCNTRVMDTRSGEHVSFL
jgi:hypothetical protein